MVYFSGQTHVLGCRSLFQCVFCLTAGVSTSSTWIKEGQPGGACPMVIREPNLGPHGGGVTGRRGRDRKPPPLSDTSLVCKATGSLKLWSSAQSVFNHTCHRGACDAGRLKGGPCRDLRGEQSKGQVHKDGSYLIWHRLPSRTKAASEIIWNF